MRKYVKTLRVLLKDTNLLTKCNYVDLLQKLVLHQLFVLRLQTPVVLIRTKPATFYICSERDNDVQPNQARELLHYATHVIKILI